MAQNPIEPIQGGTGVANSNAGTLTLSGGFPITFNFTASTNVIFPTSGTLLTTANTSNYVSSISGGSTGLTLSASTGAVSLTGTLIVANGGTGATTFTANGVLFGNTTGALGVTAAGTTGQV